MNASVEKAETQKLRDYFTPTLIAFGHGNIPQLDDEAFAGRLRRCLMVLTGGDEPVGFEYACHKTRIKDYVVTLAWQGDILSSVPHVFRAFAPNEPLALFRAAEKLLRTEHYSKMLFAR